MPKFQYKIRNTQTKKFWSSSAKASWLQEGAATHQLKVAAKRWGEADTEMVCIPLEETPGIPYQQWLDEITLKEWSDSTVQKKISFIIRMVYARLKDSKLESIETALLSDLRNTYNISSSRIDATNTSTGIYVYVSISIRITNSGEFRSYVVQQDISDPNRQIRLSALATIQASSLKSQEEQEYKLYLKLLNKFGSKAPDTQS